MTTAAANAQGMAERPQTLLLPVPAANTPAMEPGAQTPERARRRPPGVAVAVASPSSASSLEEDAAAAAAAGMGAAIEVSPLEGPHISLSEAAKRLTSPQRPSVERSMVRPGEHFWEYVELDRNDS